MLSSLGLKCLLLLEQDKALQVFVTSLSLYWVCQGLNVYTTDWMLQATDPATSFCSGCIARYLSSPGAGMQSSYSTFSKWGFALN